VTDRWPDPVSLLIENGCVVTVDDSHTVHDRGWVLIDQGRIVGVGPGEAPASARSAGKVVDAAGMAVMPGLVNAHTHLFQSFLRGLADDKPLLEWLEAAIWPVAKELTGPEARAASRLGLIENLRSGVTSVIDHQYVHTDTAIDDAVCESALETGLRFVLARGWADMDYHPEFMEDADRVLAEGERLRRRWQGAGEGRISVELAPLIPWGCSDEAVRRTVARTREWGVGTHIHVNETREEVQMNLDTRGNRPIEWLESIGALGPDLQLVHSVWLSDHELDLIAENGGVVVHCPVSNMYLASGVARVPEMLERGIPVALATDGPGSNNSQDMFETLKVTALLQKVHHLDAMAMLPATVLDMACRGGATAMGLPDDLGVLEPGRIADVILVGLESPFAAPVHRVESALVYNCGARDVDTVIVGGRVLMHRGEILCCDEAEAVAEAQDVCTGLFHRAGVATHLPDRMKSPRTQPPRR